MKSKIVSCYDYTKLDVPKELTKWHIPDEEILRELKSLSGDYAKEIDAADAVKTGDSVRCICNSSSCAGWGGRVILLYPGRMLPSAEKAEACVIGKRSGEQLKCSFGDIEAALTVADIKRRVQLPVGDELVYSLGIPNVKTVKEYFNWYHQQHDGEKRTQACYGIVSFWLKEMASRSQFSIDEVEKHDWCLQRGKIGFESMLNAGIDLRIPKEGFEILTDEQAIAIAAKDQEKYFIPFILYSYLCEKDGFAATEQDYRTEIAQIADKMGMTVEQALERSDLSMYQQKVYQEHTFFKLSKEAEKNLEG